MITSPNASSTWKERMSARAQRAFSRPSLFRRATASISGDRSAPTTLTPLLASPTAMRPVPQASSRTLRSLRAASAASS
jgi:hypothetical protein